MNFRDRLTLRYTQLLTATPVGRAHILNQVAEAEGNGEGQIFDRVLARVDDPELARLVIKHRTDETRHEELFLGCLARTGVAPGPVPTQLRIVDRIDRELGGFFDRPVLDASAVMEAYVLLQVLEERALHQFEIVEQAFRGVDPETADVFAAVRKDEERHLKYCHAISRRYAPDEATRTATLARFRRIEARAFRDNSAANMEYTLTHGMVPGRARGLAWRLVGAISRATSALPYTRFASESTATPQDTGHLAHAA